MRVFTVLLFIFLLSCDRTKNSASLRSEKVGLQLYKGFSKLEAERLAKEVRSLYGINTIILPEIDLPKSAFVSIKSPRYRADSLIKIQHKNIPNSLDYLIGFTNSDISITKKNSDGTIKKPTWRYNDFGIMGLSYCPGNSAIVSSFRLKTNNKKLFFTRLKKVTIHEFGHSLGLPHCPNKQCIMTSANEKIATIDYEKIALCSQCKSKLD